MKNCSISLFAGMTPAQKQQALSDTQQAYIELMTGSKGVSFSYTQGDGSKSVTYRSSNVSELSGLIMMLQQELGITCRARRPLRFRYR